MKWIQACLWIVLRYVVINMVMNPAFSQQAERRRDFVKGFSLHCTQEVDRVSCNPSDSDLKIVIHQNSLKSPLDIFQSVGIFVDHLDVDDVAITFRTALKFIVSYTTNFKYYHLASYLNLYELYLWKMQKFIVSKQVSEHGNLFVNYSQENLTPKMLPMKELLSLTVVITLPDCLDQNSCELAFIQSQQLVLFLREEIMQVLKLISRPRLFISMAFTEDTFDIYSNEVFERILELLKQFSPDSLGIDFGYFFKSQNVNEDIRIQIFEEIFSKVSERGLTDFYLLLDENIMTIQFPVPAELSKLCSVPAEFHERKEYNCSIDSHEFYYPLWSLSAITPLLFQGFSKSFGFSVSFSSVLLPKSEIFKPLVLAFSQKHLSIFSKENNLFRFDHSIDLNNYLYFQLYHQFHSLYCSDISYASHKTSQRDFHCTLDNLSFLFNSFSPLHYFPYEDYLDYYLQLYREVLMYFERVEKYEGVYDKLLNAFFQFGELSNVLQSSHFEFIDRRYHYSRGLNEMIIGANVEDVQHYISTTLNPSNNHSFTDSSSFLPYFFGRKFPSPVFLSRKSSKQRKNDPKIAVITAVYSNYDQTCKPYTLQTVPTHFICFTDELLIKSSSSTGFPSMKEFTSESSSVNKNNWIVDSTPYHLEYLREEFMENQVQDSDINALHHNLHPFNIAKFYKLSFHKIPILSDYDYVIWIDGSVSITNPNFTQEIVHLFTETSKQDDTDDDDNERVKNDADYFIFNFPFPYEKKNPMYFNNNYNPKDRLILLFEHIRNRNYIMEGEASMTLDRYTSRKNRQYYQSYQNITKQLHDYLFNYFLTDYYFEILDASIYNHTRPQYGLWCTCMIAFDMKKIIPMAYRRLPYVSQEKNKTRQEDDDEYLFLNVTTSVFLQYWFQQNRVYSTQDQVSFPFIVQQLQLLPFSLPDADSSIYGNYNFNSFFIKYEHGM